MLQCREKERKRRRDRKQNRKPVSRQQHGKQEEERGKKKGVVTKKEQQDACQTSVARKRLFSHPFRPPQTFDRKRQQQEAQEEQEEESVADLEGEGKKGLMEVGRGVETISDLASLVLSSFEDVRKVSESGVDLFIEDFFLSPTGSISLLEDSDVLTSDLHSSSFVMFDRFLSLTPCDV